MAERGADEEHRKGQGVGVIMTKRQEDDGSTAQVYPQQRDRGAAVKGLFSERPLRVIDERRDRGRGTSGDGETAEKEGPESEWKNRRGRQGSILNL